MLSIIYTATYAVCIYMYISNNCLDDIFFWTSSPLRIGHVWRSPPSWPSHGGRTRTRWGCSHRWFHRHSHPEASPRRSRTGAVPGLETFKGATPNQGKTIGKAQKWLVYEGKSHLEMDDLLGVPPFMESPIVQDHVLIISSYNYIQLMFDRDWKIKPRNHSSGADSRYQKAADSLRVPWASSAKSLPPDQFTWEIPWLVRIGNHLMSVVEN